MFNGVSLESLAYTTAPLGTRTQYVSWDLKLKILQISLCFLLYLSLPFPSAGPFSLGNTSHPAPELVVGSTACDMLSGLISFHPGPSKPLSCKRQTRPQGPDGVGAACAGGRGSDTKRFHQEAGYSRTQQMNERGKGHIQPLHY